MPKQAPGHPEKQARARRRRAKQREADDRQTVEEIYKKPLDDWDAEELARGRPRREDGTWPRGPKPEWITPVVEKEIGRRFQQVFMADLGGVAVQMFHEITRLGLSQERDDHGRFVVSPNVKLDTFKALAAYALGQPTSRIEIRGEMDVTAFLAEALTEDGENVVHIPEQEVVDVQYEVVEESDADLSDLDRKTRGPSAEPGTADDFEARHRERQKAHPTPEPEPDIPPPDPKPAQPEEKTGFAAMHERAAQRANAEANVSRIRARSRKRRST